MYGKLRQARFTEEERPRAVAVLMVTTVVAFLVGPILGGWLLTHFWWGSVFLINVPVSAIAVGALLPESRSPRRPRVDAVGIVLSSAGLAGLTYGLIDAGQHGWGSPRALLVVLAGTVLLVAFVAWERRVSRDGQPLVDLSLSGSASFTWGTILATVVSFAMFGLIFAAPQYFQAVLGPPRWARASGCSRWSPGCWPVAWPRTRWCGWPGPRSRWRPGSR
jgi:MFS family permease